MAWISWTQMYSDWLDAIAARNIQSFFNRSYENGREMRTTYNTLGDQQRFTEWLANKATEESLGLSSGQIPYAVGGN